MKTPLTQALRSCLAQARFRAPRGLFRSLTFRFPTRCVPCHPAAPLEMWRAVRFGSVIVFVNKFTL